MKLYQLLQSFEFEEIFPTVNVMFPNAQLHRDIFEKAFDMLCNIQPITSKKVIKFELMKILTQMICLLEQMIAVSSPHGMYAWERKSKKAKALISMM